MKEISCWIQGTRDANARHPMNYFQTLLFSYIVETTRPEVTYNLWNGDKSANEDLVSTLSKVNKQRTTKNPLCLRMNPSENFPTLNESVEFYQTTWKRCLCSQVKQASEIVIYTCPTAPLVSSPRVPNI